MPRELLNDHECVGRIQVPHLLKSPVQGERQAHDHSSVLSPFLIATSVLHCENSAGSISSTTSTETP